MNGIESKPPAGTAISTRASVPQARTAASTTTRRAEAEAVAPSPARPTSTRAAAAGSIPAQAAADAPTGSGTGEGEQVLDKAFKQMDSLEKELNGLDPEKPEDQKKLMQIQLKLQRLQQVIGLINEIRKTRHQMAMAVIGNIN
jgi:hypothetical protein